MQTLIIHQGALGSGIANLFYYSMLRIGATIKNGSPLPYLIFGLKSKDFVWYNFDA